MIQSDLDESQHEKAIGDFKRESMLLASLEHPSIPTIYDYFYDDGAGRFYLVMKYISGGDFLSRLRNAPGGRIDEQTVADWGRQVADVLHYLHSRNPPIIYRDLKPANLMIDGSSGRVMLIDFGIARWVTKQEKGVTAVGTMGYAPPELFSGKVEARSDLYSLGATMFHLLTGSDPQDNPLLIFDFIKNPAPRLINPALSNEMERLLMRAVEYKRRAAFIRRRKCATRSPRTSKNCAPVRSLTAARRETAGRQHRRGRDGLLRVLRRAHAADDVFLRPLRTAAAFGRASAALRAARATAKLIVAGTTDSTPRFNCTRRATSWAAATRTQHLPGGGPLEVDPETKISRPRAHLARGRNVPVEDLNSVNGTVINDSVRLAPRQPRDLKTATNSARRNHAPLFDRVKNGSQ